MFTPYLLQDLRKILGANARIYFCEPDLDYSKDCWYLNFDTVTTELKNNNKAHSRATFDLCYCGYCSYDIDANLNNSRIGYFNILMYLHQTRQGTTVGSFDYSSTCKFINLAYKDRYFQAPLNKITYDVYYSFDVVRDTIKTVILNNVEVK